MNDPILHLSGIRSARVRTSRLETQVLMAGADNGEAVIFLHGNLSAATYWEETMLALGDDYRAIAADGRGYGLSDSHAVVDATRGVRDWADDVLALADELRLPGFHLVAHSLGGCVAWSLLGLQPDRLRSVTLAAPGPPCGFPGAHGPMGELNVPDGAGSGAGLTHPTFLQKLAGGERGISDLFFSPRAVMNRAYWMPPFRPAREEEFLTAMLQVHIGEQQFPGDSIASPSWPGFAPGRFGPINALSPRYNQNVLGRALQAEAKPPLLWVQGAHDPVISDSSLSDPGCQGKLGLRPDWPGEDTFPPQPILTQVKAAVDQYEAAGGYVHRITLPNVGHSPFLENPGVFQSALKEHLEKAD